MSSSASRTIVVGVDGSGASVRALVWAMRRAVQEQLQVEVLTAWPAQDAVMIHEVPGHYSDARGRAAAAQRRAVVQAETELDRLPEVTVRLENQRPLDVLLTAASTSHTLVLGAARGRRHRSGARSTRLVDRCFDEAGCAVVVVGEGGAVHERTSRIDCLR